MTGGFDAVLVAGFGGPEGPDEVVPFLERVTAGRGIPTERLLEVGQHYLTLGGVSPINEQNRALVGALTDALHLRGIRIPVVLGNRNSAPFFADVVAELAASGHRRILALPTSAYSSYSGCRQYREDLWQALSDTELLDSVEIRKLRPFGYLDGFTRPVGVELHTVLAEALHRRGSLADVHVFFTTHSIPEAMLAASGPGGTDAYLAQHHDVMERVMAQSLAALKEAPEWSLVFQSRSGPPGMPWLEPDINAALRAAAESGVREVVLVPIGFISDHIEVVWDVDTQARQTAEELGLGFTRVRTPGIDDHFVSDLADLVLQHLSGSVTEPAGCWGGTCTPDCCVSARSTRDTIPAP